MLTVFELIANYSIKSWGDSLDKAKQILMVDQFLGWRQRINYNGKFLDIPTKTNELGLRSNSLSKLKKNSKNILVLGPSSTFGWGVKNDQTYSYKLQKLLEKKYPDLSINVINAGQIGYSSWQGLTFYRQELFKKFKVDILIIAYGVNDADKFRFFFSSNLPDKKEFSIPKKAWQISLQNILLNFNSLNLLSRMTFKLSDKYLCLQKNIPVRRVENDDFIVNIKELIQLGKSSSSEVVLLTSPYKLHSSSILDPETENLYHKYFNIGKNKYEEKHYVEALHYFKLASEVNPNEDETYYYLNSSYCYLGNLSERQKALSKAKLLEPNRIAKDIDKINDLLRNLSSQDEIMLVDAQKLLDTVNKDDMFVDPIHMSDAGNEKIANNLFNVIYEHDILKLNKEGLSNGQ